MINYVIVTGRDVYKLATLTFQALKGGMCVNSDI